MSFKCGIVGLPNVGKSTLFNALTASKKAQAENFPFCTIDPNVGIVSVPDERLEKISIISQSIKTINAAITFVDNDGWVNSKNNGKMRLEGKDDIVKDGDVLNSRFNT